MRYKALPSGFKASSLILRPPYTRSLCVTRTMCSKKGRDFPGDEDEDENQIHTKVKPSVVSLSQGPFGWISKHLKLFYLKTTVDSEFDEDEFLRGAKQALCFVSEQLNKESYVELEDILSDELINTLRNIRDDKTLKQVVTMKQILSANIQKITIDAHNVESGFGKAHMVADITVAFLCSRDNGEDTFQKQFGNVKIIALSIPKITYFTFRKCYFPNSPTDWQVTSISYF